MITFLSPQSTFFVKFTYGVSRNILFSVSLLFTRYIVANLNCSFKQRYAYSKYLFVVRWWNIQQVGLSVEYKSSTSEISMWLKHVFGLTCLPSDDVNDVYSFNFLSDMPDEPRIVKLVITWWKHFDSHFTPYNRGS